MNSIDIITKIVLLIAVILQCIAMVFMIVSMYKNYKDSRDFHKELNKLEEKIFSDLKSNPICLDNTEGDENEQENSNKE